MIISKNDDRNVLPTDVIGRSVAHSKRWLVAIVRIHHEKKTSERLTKMGVENFLPIQQEVHNWSDRRKVVDRVILPMMIFVHVDPQEQKEVLTLSAIAATWYYVGRVLRLLFLINKCCDLSLCSITRMRRLA